VALVHADFFQIGLNIEKELFF